MALALQATGLVDEARAWMRVNQEAKMNSKQIDQANKQLHTSLRREMERAKQVCCENAQMLESVFFAVSNLPILRLKTLTTHAMKDIVYTCNIRIVYVAYVGGDKIGRGERTRGGGEGFKTVIWWTK